MNIRSAWSVTRCPKYISAREVYNKTSIERMRIRVRNALIKTYGSIEVALNCIEVMLPSEIVTRDLSSVFTLFSLKFSSTETQAFIKFISKTSKDIITFNELCKFLTQEQSSSPLKLTLESSVRELSQSRKLVANTEGSSPYEELRILLQKHLIEKFDDFIEAFKWTTKSNTITYFHFIRLLNFLNIPSTETILQDFTTKLSFNGHITLEKFKAIWYNDENLCLITLCNNKSKLLSRYCSMHYSLIRKRGKELYKTILGALDVKSQAVVSSKINKLFFPTYKTIKEILSKGKNQ